MNLYLNYGKSNEMEAGGISPVGLLLCSEKSATRVIWKAADWSKVGERLGRTVDAYNKRGGRSNLAFSDWRARCAI